jgi:hypothetical protein
MARVASQPKLGSVTGYAVTIMRPSDESAIFILAIGEAKEEN